VRTIEITSAYLEENVANLESVIACFPVILGILRPSTTAFHHLLKRESGCNRFGLGSDGNLCSVFSRHLNSVLGLRKRSWSCLISSRPAESALMLVTASTLIRPAVCVQAALPSFKEEETAAALLGSGTYLGLIVCPALVTSPGCNPGNVLLDTNTDICIYRCTRLTTILSYLLPSPYGTYDTYPPNTTALASPIP
jgi:hypothetical protein